MITDIAKNLTTDFIYYHYKKDDNIYDTLYDKFESGYPIIIDGHELPNFDYEYFLELPHFYTEKNLWVKPWYPSDIKHKHAASRDLGISDEEFLDQHYKANKSWNKFFDKFLPKYTTVDRCLSHRYNQLVYNRLHLDLLDDEHTGQTHQIRLFVNLDKQPRLLAFSYTVEEMYNKFYDEYKLYELDKNNLHSFIEEIRNRCIWNDYEEFSSDTFPKHYVTLAPKSIWLFNANWISHQIVFGNKIQCFEADIDSTTLVYKNLAIPNRVAALP